MNDYNWRPFFTKLDNGVYLKSDYLEHYNMVFREFGKFDSPHVQIINNFLTQFREWVQGKIGYIKEVSLNNEWRYIAEWLGPTELARLKSTCSYMNSNIKLEPIVPNDLEQRCHIVELNNIWLYCNRAYLRKQYSIEKLGIDKKAPLTMKEIIADIIKEELEKVNNAKK